MPMNRNYDGQFDSQTGKTADFNSAALDLDEAVGYAIQVNLTDNGAGAGSVALQATVDGTNYVEISGTSTTIAFASGVQSIIWNVAEPFYKKVRVAYTISAGNIDATAYGRVYGEVM